MIKFATWLPAISLAAAAAIPWMGFNWKFSLRILLIGMTLAAVAIGLIVAFS